MKCAVRCAVCGEGQGLQCGGVQRGEAQGACAVASSRQGGEVRRSSGWGGEARWLGARHAVQRVVWDCGSACCARVFGVEGCRAVRWDLERRGVGCGILWSGQLVAIFPCCLRLRPPCFLLPLQTNV